VTKIIRISISDLKDQPTVSFLKDEKNNLISAAIDRSLNSRKISGGCLSLCGGRTPQDY
jgi:hypothetical protein